MKEGMKRTQRCIKLVPHPRGVDKKTLSKLEQALHSDGERGRMKENKGEKGRERKREGEKGKTEETENEGRETNRGQTMKTETNAVSHFFPSPSTFSYFYDFSVLVQKNDLAL